MAGKGRDRIVFQRADNTWANKRNDAGKASSVHKTQADAVKTAKSMLENQGGGELLIKGTGGKPIRSKDTVFPGNESKVKDKEH